MTTCRRILRVVATGVCLSLWLSSPLLAQRADRATISGVVTDAQGVGGARRNGHHPQ